LEDEAIGILFDTIKSDPSDLTLVNPVLETIVNLSSDDKVTGELCRVPDGISTILDYLLNKSTECQGYAAVIICNIARNPDLLYAISKRALPDLLELTKISDSFGQIQAAAALHYLAKQETNKVDMCACDNFSNLINLLSSDGEGARNASWALEQIVSNADCALKIVSKIGMPTLVKYLSSTNSDIKSAMVFVIYKALRADMNLKASIKEAGAMSPLQQIEKTSEKRIASFATYMLQVISK